MDFTFNHESEHCPVKNPCYLCGDMFSSNDALIAHLRREHQFYDCRKSPPPALSRVKLSQQQIASGTITNMYRQPNNIPVNQYDNKPNQPEKSPHQYVRDNLRRNVTQASPLGNQANMNITRNLQAAYHEFLNTVYKTAIPANLPAYTNMQNRNYRQNANVRQQNTPIGGTKFRMPYGAVQQPPATLSPEMQYDFKDHSDLRKIRRNYHQNTHATAQSNTAASYSQFQQKTSTTRINFQMPYDAVQTPLPSPKIPNFENSSDLTKNPPYSNLQSRNYHQNTHATTQGNTTSSNILFQQKTSPSRFNFQMPYDAVQTPLPSPKIPNFENPSDLTKNPSYSNLQRRNYHQNTHATTQGNTTASNSQFQQKTSPSQISFQMPYDAVQTPLPSPETPNFENPTDLTKNPPYSNMQSRNYHQNTHATTQGNTTANNSPFQQKTSPSQISFQMPYDAVNTPLPSPETPNFENPTDLTKNPPYSNMQSRNYHQNTHATTQGNTTANNSQFQQKTSPSQISFQMPYDAVHTPLPSPETPNVENPTYLKKNTANANWQSRNYYQETHVTASGNITISTDQFQQKTAPIETNLQMPYAAVETSSATISPKIQKTSKDRSDFHKIPADANIQNRKYQQDPATAPTNGATSTGQFQHKHVPCDIVQKPPARLTPEMQFKFEHPCDFRKNTEHFNTTAQSNTSFASNGQFVRKTTPTESNSQMPHDVVQKPPATITPPKRQNITFGDPSELRNLLISHGNQKAFDDPIKQRHHQNSTSTSQNANLVDNATLPQIGNSEDDHGMNQNNTKLFETDYVVWYYCTICGMQIDKATDRAKHKKQFHSDVEKNKTVFKTIKYPRISILGVDAVNTNSSTIQQKNTELGFAPHSSQSFHSISPKTLNNLIENLHRDIELSISQSTTKKDDNISKTNNIIEESKHVNNSKRKSVDSINKLSRFCSGFTASNEDDGFTTNKEISLSKNMHENGNLPIDDKYFERLNEFPSSEYHTNAYNDGQYNNTIKTHENEQKSLKYSRSEFRLGISSSDVDDENKCDSFAARCQTNDTETKRTTKTNECSDSGSLKEDEVSNADIVEKNKQLQQETKTRKRKNSDSSHGESLLQLNSPTDNQNSVLNLVKTDNKEEKMLKSRRSEIRLGILSSDVDDISKCDPVAAKCQTNESETKHTIKINECSDSGSLKEDKLSKTEIVEKNKQIQQETKTRKRKNSDSSHGESLLQLNSPTDIQNSVLNLVKTDNKDEKMIKSRRSEFRLGIFSSGVHDASKSNSIAAKDQTIEIEAKHLRRTNECSDSDSLKEDEKSKNDIVKENQVIQQGMKTSIRKQSDSSPGELPKVNQNSKMVKDCGDELLHPTSNDMKSKTKNKPKQKLFKCTKCPKHFVEQEELHKHNRHNRKPRICSNCQLDFSKKSLKKHVKEHHTDKKNLTLEDFDIVTNLSSTSSDSSDSSISTHISATSPGRIDSANTNIDSPNPSLKSHEPVTSNERQIEQANRQNNSETLKDNLSLNTSVENNKNFGTLDDKNLNVKPSRNSKTFVVFKCAECDKCFIRVTVKLHKKVCGKYKSKKCDLCPLKFSENALKVHKKEHHNTTTTNVINLVIIGNNNVVRTETLMLKNTDGDQKENKYSKSTPEMNTHKKKIIMSEKLLRTIYRSYSETIYKCRKCNTCFVTKHKILSHLQYERNSKSNRSCRLEDKQKCPTCKLYFSKVTLSRHHDFHHDYLKLKNESDFTITVRPTLKVKTSNPKEIAKSLIFMKTDKNTSRITAKQKHESNIKKSRLSLPEPKDEINKKKISLCQADLKKETNDKEMSYCPSEEKTGKKSRHHHADSNGEPSSKRIRHSSTYSKSETSSSQKDKTVRGESTKYRHESDRRHNYCRQEENIPKIQKNISNQTQLNTEADVNILYKCLPCDVMFMEKTSYQSHLTSNHIQTTEPYLCTFCKYRFLVSIESFKLHMELHFKNRSINNLIVENSTIPGDTIQTSGQNNIKLKECIVKLTNLQSTVVSTTTTCHNSKSSADIKQPLNSKEYSDHNSPSLNTSEYEESIADYKDNDKDRLFQEEYIKSHLSEDGGAPEFEHLMPNANSQLEVENYVFVETTAINVKDDLFTTEDTFELNFTNNHVERTEYQPLLQNDIQENETDTIRNDHDKEINSVLKTSSSQNSIQILSNVVLKQTTIKVDQQPDAYNEAQSENLVENSADDEKCVLVSSTNTNQEPGTKGQTELTLENSNTIRDDSGSNLHEQCENSGKHPSLRESAENILSKSRSICEMFTPELETEDNSESLSILSSSQIKKIDSKSKKSTFDFDAVDNVENNQKIEADTGPKLKRSISKSTEDLIKLLEDDPSSENNKPAEIQENSNLEIPLLVLTDTFVTEHTVTASENDKIVVATNKSESDRLITKSNTDIKSNIPAESIDSSESNERCEINRDLINISENNLEILTIDDDELVENEQLNETNSPFTVNLYESNTENITNDVNLRKPDRKPVNIKPPIIKEIITIDDEEPLENEQLDKTDLPIIKDLSESNIENYTNDVNPRIPDKKSINIKLSTIKEIVIIEDAEPVENEQLNETESPVTEDLSESNIENYTNDVNPHKPDKKSINIKLPTIKEIVIIDDSESVDNEQLNETNSLVTEDLYESNTENYTNDVNPRIPDKKSINIKLPTIKEIVIIDDSEPVDNKQLDKTDSPITEDLSESNKENYTNDVNPRIPDKKSISIKLPTIKEIVTIDDEEIAENEPLNETDSPFIDDLDESNTENITNDVNPRKPDRKPINIKLPAIKFTAITPFLNPDLPTSNEGTIELDDVIISSTNTEMECERRHGDNVTTTVVNDNDDFKRDVENVISNIEKETSVDKIVSSSSSDTIIAIIDDDD